MSSTTTMQPSGLSLKRTRSIVSSVECSIKSKRYRSSDTSNGSPYPGASPFKTGEDNVFLAADNNVFSSPKYHLPKVCSSQVQSGAFRSISAAVLSTLIKSMSEEEFKEKYFLVDCRYPYEFFGGHIKSAQNHYDPNMIGEIFYPEDKNEAEKMKKRIPIFYCEFSQKRGPAMGHKLREFDRKKNLYPALDFPEIYLLDRGYSNFFAEDVAKNLCEPMYYVKMLDDRHKDTLRRMSFHRSKSSSVFTRTTSCVFKGRAGFEERYSTSAIPNVASTFKVSTTSELDVSMTAATASPISRCRSRGSMRSVTSLRLPRKLSFDE